MIDHTAPQAGQTVLDLAAGIGDTGFLAAELIEPGGTLITSDVVPEMLSAAQRRAEALGIRNVRFKQIDASQPIDLEAASIDVVLCRWGYMLMDDPETALRETRRVLRPGGRVALAAWTGAEDNPWSALPIELLLDRGLIDPIEPAGPRRPVRLGGGGHHRRAPRGRRLRRVRGRGARLPDPLPVGGGVVGDGALDGHARRARPAFDDEGELLSALADGGDAVDRRRRLAGDPRQDVGGRGDGITSRAHVLRRRRRSRPCSTARPWPSSATAPRATPTRSTSRTPASTSSSGSARTPSSVEQARSKGLEVTDIADAASRGDIVMVLLPDERHGEVWREPIRDGIAPGNTLLFGHGFSVHYGEVEPPPEVDVALIAPKGPGHLVRRQYLEGSGVPGLVAVHADPSGDALPARARLRQGHRLHARRRDRDDVQGRDRDRPVRRAGRALRRRVRARAGRLRDAGRRRLRLQARVLRVPARAEADRRPDVREGHHRDALLGLQHGRVRRLHARQADHLRRPRARR